MKHLLWSIVATMAVLVAAVTGCGRAPRYDARLVAIDSLMHDAPDSALALVQAIGTLPAPADRAYRNLLLTQARYRCYVAATSDSDINRALAYYRGHSGEREKLTRAFIYKGAVMDELGHPDSAMLYYKHAEATAAPDDYFNLGYAKMRIATLYQDQLSQDSSAIIALKQAIRCFSIVRDTSLLISCYGDLGAICGVRYPDSTEYYLNRAIELAQLTNPPKQYTYKSKLAGFKLYYNKDYSKANELSMDVLRNGKEFCNEHQFYYYAALSYLRLGMVDSARHVFNITPAPQDNVDSMNYYSITAELERIENHPESYASNAFQSATYENKIMSESREKQLMKREADFERKQIENNNGRLVKRSKRLFAALLVFTLAVILFIYHIRRYHDRLEYQLHELEHECNELETSLVNFKRQKEAGLNDITKYVGYRISAINELYDAIRVKWDDNSKVKKIIPLSGLLSSLHERRLLMRVELKDSFWKKMKQSVNGELKGIVTYAERQYPELTEDDIKMFCLLCAKISPQIIRLCMNFDSAKTVTNYRSKLIKKKMGLDMTFDEFVYKYLNNELKN